MTTAYVPEYRADNVYIGHGTDQDIIQARGHQGVPAPNLSLISLGAPAVEDADLLIAAATSTELPDDAGSVVFSAGDAGDSPVDNASLPDAVSLALPNGQTVTVIALDVPRNLTSTVTHATSIVAMTVTHAGYDEYRQAVTEVHTITATGTSKSVTGKKAMKWWRQTTVTVAADASANTLNVGIGKVLGLPFRLEKQGHVVAASIGGVSETINNGSDCSVVAADASAASGTTGDVRGTVSLNGTYNGSAEVLLTAYFSGRNSQAGLTGVAQA